MGDKIDQAASTLRAVGLSSARGTADGRISMTPEDSMRSLLLANPEALKLLYFSAKQRRAFADEADRLRGEIKLIETLATQLPEDCAEDRHVTRSEATGGKRGHVLTWCLCCDYTADGYD